MNEEKELLARAAVLCRRISNSKQTEDGLNYKNGGAVLTKQDCLEAEEWLNEYFEMKERENDR